MKITKEVEDYLSGLDVALQQNAICKARTIYCLNWYSRKANFYKLIYQTLSIINISVPLLSSFIIAFYPNQDLLVAILSALASFCASLLSLWGAKDKWTNYRNAAEFLKSHYTLYLLQANPYNTAERDSLYLNTIEAQMQNFHSSWIQSQKNSNDTEKSV